MALRQTNAAGDYTPPVTAPHPIVEVLIVTGTLAQMATVTAAATGAGATWKRLN